MWPSRIASLIVLLFHSSLCFQSQGCAPVFELLVTDFPMSLISTKETGWCWLSWPSYIGVVLKNERTLTLNDERTPYLQLLHLGSEGKGQDEAVRARRSEASFRIHCILSGWVSMSEEIKQKWNIEQEYAGGTTPKHSIFHHQWILQLSISICVHGADPVTKTGAGYASSR